MPGTHIKAAGSNHLRRRELDGQAVRRARRIAAHSLEQAKMGSGDLARAVDEGRLRWHNIRVYELAKTRNMGQNIPLFD